MSKLSSEEVQQLGKLARLALSDAEVGEMQNELSSILGHMEKLSELDTAGVTPMTHASTDVASGLRPDVVEPSLPLDAVLAAGSYVLDDSFSVPAILPSGTSSD